MYAIYGQRSADLLTFEGRVIVHDNRGELEFLLPRSRVVRVTAADVRRRSPLPPLQLRDHPGLSHLRWPLTRDQFQEGSRHGRRVAKDRVHHVSAG